MKKKINIKYPPILLFAYNRPNHFKRTLTSLAKNHNAKKYKLIIFIDGPKTETDKKKADKISKETLSIIIEGVCIVALPNLRCQNTLA